MALWTIRVKTLDGSDHVFEISPNETTIKDLKEKILETLQVPLARQRLIYRGRVLHNEQRLIELELDGQVIHMVERPPNVQVGQGSRNGPVGAHSGPGGGGVRVGGGFQDGDVLAGAFQVHGVQNLTTSQVEGVVRRVLGTLGPIGRNSTVTVNDRGNGNADISIELTRTHNVAGFQDGARQRLEHAEHVLGHTEHILERMATDNENTSTNETSSASHRRSEFSSGGDLSGSAGTGTSDSDCGPQAQPDTEASRERRGTEIQRLAEVFERVVRVNSLVTEQLPRYTDLLRSDPVFEESQPEAQQSLSLFFNNFQAVLHNLSHVYHALSDINVHFCETPPRHLYPITEALDANGDRVENAEQHTTHVNVVINLRDGRPALGVPPLSPPARTSTDVPTSSAETATRVSGNDPPAPFTRPTESAATYCPDCNGEEGAEEGERTVAGDTATSTSSSSATFTFQGDNNTASSTHDVTATTASSAQTPPSAASTATAAPTATQQNGAGVTAGGTGNNVDMGNLISGLLTGMFGGAAGVNWGPPGAPQPQAAPPFGFPSSGPIRVQVATTTVPIAVAEGGAGGATPHQFRMRFTTAPSTTGTTGHMIFGPFTTQATGGFPGIPPPWMGEPQPQRAAAPQRAAPNRRPVTRLRAPAQGGRQPYASLSNRRTGMRSSLPPFVGPHPPEQLPLFTMDPHLPCASRHFARAVNRAAANPVIRGAPQDANSERFVWESNAERASEPQTNGSADSEPTVAASAEAPAASQERTSEQELESQLGGFLRRVVAGMQANPESQPNVFTEHGLGAHPIVSVAMESGVGLIPSTGPYPTYPGGGAGIISQGPPGAANLGAEREEAEGNEGGGEANQEQRQHSDMWRFMGTALAGFATGGQGQTLGQLLRSYESVFSSGRNNREGGSASGNDGDGNEAPSGNAQQVENSGSNGVSDLTFRFLDLFTFQDAAELFNQGNPRCLDRFATELRQTVSELLFDGNGSPSRSEVETAAIDFVANSDIFLHDREGRLTPFEPDVDVTASLARCQERAVQDLLNILFGHIDYSGTLGEALYNRGLRSLRQVLHLGVHLSANGLPGFETYLSHYLTSDSNQSAGVPPEMGALLTRTGLAHVRRVLEGSATPPDVSEFVIRRAPIQAPPVVETTQPEGEDSRIAPEEQAPKATFDSSEEEEFMDTSDILPSSHQHHKRPLDATRNGPPFSSPPLPISEGDPLANWERHMPPEWIDVIKQDEETQLKQEIQRPFSDAYISGMPPKKRKRYIHEKLAHVPCIPTSNGGSGEERRGTDDASLLAETLKGTLEQLGVQSLTGEGPGGIVDSLALSEDPNSDLVKSFAEERKRCIVERLSTDPDFDPEKFPNASRYFKAGGKGK